MLPSPGKRAKVNSIREDALGSSGKGSPGRLEKWGDSWHQRGEVAGEKGPPGKPCSSWALSWQQPVERGPCSKRLLPWTKPSGV